MIEKLNEIDENDYDFVDFSSQNQQYSVFLGRGFCMDQDPNIIVTHQGEEIYNGPIYLNDCDFGDPAEMRVDFENEHDVKYDEVLSGTNDETYDADTHFFENATQYAYCSLETVVCYKSQSTVTIEVDDDFKLSDLKIKFMDVDTGDTGSITQEIYQVTDLESQVYGIEYKGEFYEFEGGEDEGGTNAIYWFTKNADDQWESDVNSDDLPSWFSFL
jgi:hypothetical protein